MAIIWGMEVTEMKKIIRKFVISAMAMAILFTNVSMVEASELKASDVTVYEKEADAVARATKAYSFGRTKCFRGILELQCLKLCKL